MTTLQKTATQVHCYILLLIAVNNMHRRCTLPETVSVVRAGIVPVRRRLPLYHCEIRRNRPLSRSSIVQSLTHLIQIVDITSFMHTGEMVHHQRPRIGQEVYVQAELPTEKDQSSFSGRTSDNLLANHQPSGGGRRNHSRL